MGYRPPFVLSLGFTNVRGSPGSNYVSFAHCEEQLFKNYYSKLI